MATKHYSSFKVYNNNGFEELHNLLSIKKVNYSLNYTNITTAGKIYFSGKITSDFPFLQTYLDMFNMSYSSSVTMNLLGDIDSNGDFNLTTSFDFPNIVSGSEKITMKSGRLFISLEYNIIKPNRNKILDYTYNKTLKFIENSILLYYNQNRHKYFNNMNTIRIKSIEDFCRINVSKI